MKKIIVSGLVAGVAIFVVSMVLSQLTNFLLPNIAQEYQNSGIFRPWSDPLMSLYFLYPFILGLVLAWFWDKTKGSFKNTKCGRGVCFGFSYWLVASIPGMLITYSSFTVSLIMVISWSLVGLVEALAAGWVLSKMNK